MQLRKQLIAGLMLIATQSSSAKPAEIDLLEWTLRTDVRFGNGNDGRVQTMVTNPLQHTYFASLGNSTASSTINASWDAAGFFDFFLTGEYADQGSGSLQGFSRSSGSVLFIPAVDSIITIDAEFNYALGSGDRESELKVNIGGGPAPPSSLFSQSWAAIPIGGSSPNGTFTIHASIPVLADEFYNFGYRLALYSYGGSPTNLSMGNGYVHATIVPVPEPATLALLFVVAPPLRKRRRAQSLR
ncbi:MAG: hypothetical protein H6819_07490 [Phycisphaerales bacterium]|nr:hypothetical protein [Phycisphaerales bacterium]MCB9857663.1 hypothetical protein [Phycisphaerales bacterium]